MKLSKQNPSIPSDLPSPLHLHSTNTSLLFPSPEPPLKDQTSSTTTNSTITSKHILKPKKISHRLTRSQEYVPEFHTDKFDTDYDKLATSRKLKDNYLKKFTILTNRINKLKMHEKELETKLKNRFQKERKIETIKKDKVHFKNEINKFKEQKQQTLQEQKERIKTRRENDAERVNTLNEITAEKRKNLFDISKAEQNLIKTMITQTNTKTEAINKYKYIQSKEQQALNKQLEKKRKLEKENKRMSLKKAQCENNMLIAEQLKEKCNELEKLEEEYLNNLKKTKMKATTITTTMGIINKSFLDESLKTVNEINNSSIINTNTNTNTTRKHKSRSIKSNNLKGGNNTKNYSKEVFNNINNNKQQQQQIQQQRNQHPLNKDNNKKLCESCMTMNILSQYKP